MKKNIDSHGINLVGYIDDKIIPDDKIILITGAKTKMELDEAFLVEPGTKFTLMEDALTKIQREHKPWCDYNFGGIQAWEPILGMTEELGELSHAFLKTHQGVRINEDHKADLVDSLADLIIFACSFANKLDINLSQVLLDTWNQVKQRDWRKFPETGLPPIGTNTHCVNKREL